MKRAILLLVATSLGVLALAGIALALPAETPDNTPMVDGPVRGIAQVGNNVWVVGNFDRVERRDGSLLDSVRNVAVFDAATGQYKDIAPMLGGPTAVVRDVAPYGSSVVIGGSFGGPSGTQKNLVRVDGTTGAVVRWYDSSALQSVLAAPELGRVYGGGTSLSAFDATGGQRLWTRSPTAVDPSLRSHATTAGYRDLELDGQTIWAACACDTVSGAPAKALVKLNIEGVHDTSYVPRSTGFAAFGISVLEANGALYLAAGGNDFLAQYSKADGGRVWWRDTSGSAQAVEEMGGGLVVGGHFLEVADAPADRCGFRSSNNAATLDPFGECQTRHGLAFYSFGGNLDPAWDPMLSGRYNLAWALLPQDTTLYVGGEYLRVNGIVQSNFARFSG